MTFDDLVEPACLLVAHARATVLASNGQAFHVPTVLR